MRSVHIFGFLYFILTIIFSQCAIIEEVDDSDLMHLLTTKDNIIALFSKSDCPKCEEIENVLENIHDQLVDTLASIIVKASNSQLTNIYNPTGEPSLIFFRRGIPLLYYGEVNNEEILRYFTDNRNPVVKELSDENFEHLTQAASGATTGDWFVFFYSADCILCQRLYAIWEAVGARLRHRLNVARINRTGAGVSTAKRFGVLDSPTFLFLKQEKMYTYKLKNFSPKSFLDFVEKGYHKISPQMVPGVEDMNDILYKYYQIWISKISNQTVIGSCLLLILLVIFWKIYCRRENKKNILKPKRK